MIRKFTISRLLLTWCLCALFGMGSYAQTSVQVVMTNDAQISPTEYQFDIILISTGSSTFQLSGHQYGINYNSGIKNGGTITASWVSGSTQLTNAAQLPSSINTTSNASQIRIAAPPAPGAGNGSIIATGAGSRVGRLKIVNTVPFATAQPNLGFGFTANATSTRTSISWYNGTTNTIFCSPVVTTGCSGTSTFSVTTSNPILNAPSCTAPTLSGSVTNVDCQGNATGSIDLTLTGGTPSPFSILWSNGANTEDISGLSAGTYSVTVTTDGGQCTATASYTVQGGAPSTTNTTTINSCGSYTWSVNGTTYTQTGNYTSVSGCNTQILALTVTTPPQQPSLACYETATFNNQTCSWDVTGTQPAQPNTACYETATFNNQTCSWDVTGTQPQQPTLAC